MIMYKNAKRMIDYGKALSIFCVMSFLRRHLQKNLTKVLAENLNKTIETTAVLDLRLQILNLLLLMILVSINLTIAVCNSLTLEYRQSSINCNWDQNFHCQAMRHKVQCHMMAVSAVAVPGTVGWQVRTVQDH